MIYIDENGKWEINEYGVKMLIEPSQKWIDEHPAPEPTDQEKNAFTILQDDNTALKQKNAQLEAKVKALTESSQMLEDCLVEMAEIVYA